MNQLWGCFGVFLKGQGVRQVFTYNQLSAGLDHDDPASLVRLAANAFKKGILRLRVKGILSFSPVIRAIKEEKGEQACQRYMNEAMREGWKIKRQEQTQQYPPNQQRRQGVNRSPGLGR